MSKYPVEISDLDGVVAGVNYLLSGPAGLGQNFSGKSFEASDTYFSGSPNGPYLLPSSSTYGLYVAPISLSTSEMLDEVTYKFTFTTPETNPPFYLGQPILVSDVVDDTYNQIFSPIGVVECTTDYVIARSLYPVDVVTSSTGGTVELNVATPSSPGIVTDCQATVNITGATDRVFLSGQVGFQFLYDAPDESQLFVNVFITREKIGLNNEQTEYSIVFTQNTVYDFVTAESGTKDINAIFTSFIDQDYQGVSPSIGQYVYKLQITFLSFGLLPNPITISSVYAGTRTLTAQVVKQ